MKNKGFTLVELLVAVTIIVMVLGAAVSLEVQHIRAADANKHKLQAENLAQQALNLTRTIRDNNLLNPTTTTPFAGIDNGDHCLQKDADGKWSLGSFTATTPTAPGNCQTNLDNTKYDVKITVEE